MDAAKDQLPELWKSMTADSALSLSGGISKIWLDGKVRAVLDKSVPQIGAPAAWQAGYDGSGVKVAVLDTGIDADAPGPRRQGEGGPGLLRQRDRTRDDHFGHGTHVAATIAGTGAGAGGTRKGVAPEAELLVGKVLADDGCGLRLLDHRRDGVGRRRAAPRWST